MCDKREAVLMELYIENPIVEVLDVGAVDRSERGWTRMGSAVAYQSTRVQQLATHQAAWPRANR